MKLEAGQTITNEVVKEDGTRVTVQRRVLAVQNSGPAKTPAAPAEPDVPDARHV